MAARNETYAVELRTLLTAARTLTHSYGVDVTISGREAYTGRKPDGRWAINVPVITAPDKFLLAHGYIDHEAAHVLFSDMSEIEHCAHDKLLASMLNVFEDARVERCISAMWRGCGANLAALNDSLLQDNPDAGATLVAHAMNFCLLSTFHRNATKTRAMLDKGAPGLADALLPVIARNDTSTSTADCKALAQDVYDILQQYHLEEQNLVRVAQRDADDNGPGDEPLPDNTTGGFSDKSERARDALQHFNVCDSSITGELATTSALTRVAGAIATSRIATSQVLMAEGIIHAMTARLRVLLQAQQIERRLPAYRGRINTRALYRSAHDAKVFLRSTPVRQVNTEIIVLLDISGSMDGPRINTASAAMYAVLACARSIRGVRSSAYVFNTQVRCLLPADKFLTTNIQPVCCGGTMLGRGLLTAVQAFTNWKPEARRVVIAMTDGDTSDNILTHSICDAMADYGVELYGIGIQSGALNQYRMPSRKINDLQELPEALFEILSKAVL